MLRQELDEARASAAAAALAASGERSHFVGARGTYTPELKFWDPSVDEATPRVLPVFRLLDDLGNVVPGAEPAMPAPLSTDMTVAESYKTIRRELEEYGAGLDEKPEIIAINKTDALLPEFVEEMTAELRTVTEAPIFAVSGITGNGVTEVLRALFDIIKKDRAREAAEEAAAASADDTDGSEEVGTEGEEAGSRPWSPEVSL